MKKNVFFSLEALIFFLAKQLDFCLKISKKMGLGMKPFAGGPRPAAKKRSQEQCQMSLRQRMDATISSPS